MRNRNLAAFLHTAARALAWFFVAVGLVLTIVGTWTWIMHRNDDILAIYAFFSFSAGLYLTVSILPYALKRGENFASAHGQTKLHEN